RLPVVRDGRVGGGVGLGPPWPRGARNGAVRARVHRRLRLVRHAVRRPGGGAAGSRRRDHAGAGRGDHRAGNAVRRLAAGVLERLAATRDTRCGASGRSSARCAFRHRLDSVLRTDARRRAGAGLRRGKRRSRCPALGDVRAGPRDPVHPGGCRVPPRAGRVRLGSGAPGAGDARGRRDADRAGDPAGERGLAGGGGLAAGLDRRLRGGRVSAPARPATASRPGPPSRPPALSAGELARWAWRQLTSMRAALSLLFLLAVAAIPGSLIPQRNVDPLAVREFAERNPGLAQWYERLSLFDVYSAPWFAAIYLALMVSLVGCIVPRSRDHWRAMRARPPR